VLRETTSRGLCGLVCPSRTSERGRGRLCERRRREKKGEGERERERAEGVLSFATTCHDTTLRRKARRPSPPTHDATQRTFV
jgi:hypothetical protein